jgi:hypothetical protein
MIFVPFEAQDDDSHNDFSLTRTTAEPGYLFSVPFGQRSEFDYIPLNLKEDAEMVSLKRDLVPTGGQGGGEGGEPRREEDEEDGRVTVEGKEDEGEVERKVDQGEEENGKHSRIKTSFLSYIVSDIENGTEENGSLNDGKDQLDDDENDDNDDGNLDQHTHSFPLPMHIQTHTPKNQSSHYPKRHQYKCFNFGVQMLFVPHSLLKIDEQDERDKYDDEDDDERDEEDLISKPDTTEDDSGQSNSNPGSGSGSSAASINDIPPKGLASHLNFNTDGSPPSPPTSPSTHPTHGPQSAAAWFPTVKPYSASLPVPSPGYNVKRACQPIERTQVILASFSSIHTLITSSYVRERDQAGLIEYRLKPEKDGLPVG